MSAVSLKQAAELICRDLNLGVEPPEFLALCAEDEIGGYPEKWPMGSIWDVEGRVLYALARILKPSHVVEVGTGGGCSTAHLEAAVRKYRPMGKIWTVDVGGNPPDFINKSKHVVRAAMDGIEFLNSWDEGLIDLLFEDGPHSTEFTCMAILTAMPHLSPGAVVVVHDAEHFLVGQAVSSGIHQAVGDFGHVLIEPSDCGLGYWRKGQ